MSLARRASEDGSWKPESSARSAKLENLRAGSSCSVGGCFNPCSSSASRGVE